MSRRGPLPPPPVRTSHVEIEGGDSWPPRVIVRPEHSAYRVTPPLISASPPGMKRYTWMRTWILAAVALMVLGWKARELIIDYPTRTEIASMIATQMTVEREVREQAERGLLARVLVLEDAGVQTSTVVGALVKQVDSLDKRKRAPIVTFPRP